MMCNYFSHDVNAQNNDKCIRLIYELGWEGYGVFWGIIERMNASDECELANSPANLAWSMHANEDVLKRVINDFGLFVFSEDGTRFWSESARRRRMLRVSKRTSTPVTNGDAPKRKRGRPRKHPLPEPENEPETVSLQVDNEHAENDSSGEEVQNEACHVAGSSFTGANEDEYAPFESDSEDDASQANLSETVIAHWNKIFAGTKQVYRGLALDAISFQRMNETFTSGFTIEDFDSAFKSAKDDDFTWLLRDVLKTENIQRLLAKGERNGERTTNANANSDWELPAELRGAD